MHFFLMKSLIFLEMFSLKCRIFQSINSSFGIDLPYNFVRVLVEWYIIQNEQKTQQKLVFFFMFPWKPINFLTIISPFLLNKHNDASSFFICCPKSTSLLITFREASSENFQKFIRTSCKLANLCHLWAGLMLEVTKCQTIKLTLVQMNY